MVPELLALPGRHSAPVCGQAKPGEARCHAQVMTDAQGVMAATTTPKGYGRIELLSAYNFPPDAGWGVTVGIVDFGDDPTAESDLGVYRSQYGLPPCTTANGCFRKVNQNGASSPLPAKDAAASVEISLDIQTASAVCPHCNILLIEANSASTTDLFAAEDEVVVLGAAVVSNSWGTSEYAQETGDEVHFHHPGVAVFASSGDTGYGAQFPAASRYVTAVGGTSLAQSAGGGWSETVWNDTQGAPGSGCSSYISKPAWQNDSTCKTRMEADVSAVADPATGVAVYDSSASSPGWQQVGGTSLASPLVAAIYALTGHTQDDPSLAWKFPGAFMDITSGSNGTCSVGYYCNAATGYDGPTGFGTPKGDRLAQQFSLSLSPPAMAVAMSGSAQIQVTTALTAGSMDPIQLSISGLPMGITANFSPPSVAPGGSSTLTLSADGTTANLPTSDLVISARGASRTVTAHESTGVMVMTGAAPADQMLQATGSAGAVATWSLPKVQQSGVAVPVTCTPASGSIFPIGVTQVTCSAMGSGGGALSLKFHVTVMAMSGMSSSGQMGGNDNMVVQGCSAAGGPGLTSLWALISALARSRRRQSAP
jgi:hypothetical protein